MNDPQQTTLWLGALRYYLGRQTYAVSDFCDILRSQWLTLPEKLQQLIQRDVEEAFARDDRAREDCSSYRTLGADCDRAEWEKVRGLWKSQ